MTGATGRRRSDAKRGPSGREKGFWHYLSLSLSAALLILVIGLALVVVVIPKIAGAVPLTVLTSSMEPRLPPGTLLVVKPIDPDDLHIGDIATYQIQPGVPGVISHRIIAIDSTSNGSRTFTFKGDNNSDADEDAVVPAQIQGKLWYSVPLIGWANNAVNGRSKTWLLPALAVLLFAYAGYSVTSGIRSAVKARRLRRTREREAADAGEFRRDRSRRARRSSR